MSGGDIARIQSPLPVESGFVASRATFLAARGGRALSPEEAADLLFLDGMAAFEQAVTASDGSEDSEPDPTLLQQSLAHLADAAKAFHEQQRAVDEAYTHFRMARGLQRVMRRAEAYREAAEHYRKGLELLDTVAHPELAFEAYLNLGKVLHKLASALVGEPREVELRRALAVLQAAEFLASGLSDPFWTALQKQVTALALGKRFRPHRDENLLDAIALAEEALPFFRKAPDRAPIEYGALLVHVGNSWLKVARDRQGALEYARAAFREGASAVDPGQFPRLHRVLAGNLTMTEALIAQGNFDLPEKEMVGRFDAEIQANLKASRLSEALQTGWAFLRWAWSLSLAPNVHVGAAHKILGNLYFRRGDIENSEMHLYSSLTVLAAVLAPAHPWFPMVGEAKQDLAKLFQATQRPDIATPAIAQVARAVSIAHDVCRRGAERIQTDPAAALTDFQEALRLFPCSPDALFYRGVVHMQSGDFSAALADFDASLLFRPRNIPALGNRFTMRLRLGDREGALADCDAILELDASHDGAILNRAELKAQKADWDGAIADYGKLLDLHPDAAEFLVRRAAAREKKDDLEGAVEDLEHALATVQEPEDKKALAEKIAALRAQH
jgi:tetratricopeptide (TPR) repeat protein